jgi:hypothetical protein
LPSWKGKVMNKSEVKLLLADVSAIDNRRVSEETVVAWHAVLGHLSLPVAQRALVLARQDEKVDYLEPRHIVARARDARMSIDRGPEARAEEAKWRSDPVPVCIPHKTQIIDCQPCIALLMKHTDGMSIDQRHRWAMSNIGYLESVS